MAAPLLKKTITKLDLLSLRLFLTICEERSIGRAAERECITPSAVTKRVQDLEYLFDVKLLYRSAKGTVPTPVGEALAQHARDIFELVGKIRTDLSEFSEGVKGHIRIAATASALTGFATADMRDFVNLYPQVDLDVRELMSADVLHAVATGTADIGIYASHPSIGGDVESFFCRHDELQLLVPKDSPLASRSSVSFAELFDYDFISLQENSSVMSQLRKAATGTGRQFNPRYVVQSNEVARSMVAAGFGITILPIHLNGACNPAQIATVALSDAWAKREIRVCARRDMHLPAQARLLLDFFLNQDRRTEPRKPEVVKGGVVKLRSVG
ncbi:LysR family transcriptional regulator [Mesorhizobium sp. ANAO-SY3R2]|uniref:LysR family transcriptional regulator n=1 Tax=Mesorhizobium sp. ANAO-SY3R2 TaxID=3166644 RepID=UPI00366B7F6F